jgi:2-hydroxychromene-2-carboxylate isomerase/predicted thioesterase
MRPIKPGSTKTISVAPEPWQTAAAIGNIGIDAISTPSVLGFLEQASLAVIEDHLEDGELSVGHFVELHHVRPAFVGRTIECNATLKHISGRRLTFLIEARQGEHVIAHGNYIRVVVSAERFTRARANSEMPPLQFYFDFHSPWSYLAALRLPSIAARHGRVIDWIPIHLARLIESIGGRNVLSENSAFVRWYKQDMQDWAQLHGVTIRYHAKFPLRTAPALRASAYVAQQRDPALFIQSVMRSYWSEGRDISELEELKRISAECGLDPQAIAAATNDPEMKRKVLENTAAAAEAGLFGTPSVIADGKLFFGNDRLDLLNLYLGDRPHDTA